MIWRRLHYLGIFRSQHVSAHMHLGSLLRAAMASEPRAANSATHGHKNNSSKCAAWSSLVKCQWGLITVERKILGKRMAQHLPSISEYLKLLEPSSCHHECSLCTLPGKYVAKVHEMHVCMRAALHKREHIAGLLPLGMVCPFGAAEALPAFFFLARCTGTCSPFIVWNER